MLFFFVVFQSCKIDKKEMNTKKEDISRPNIIFILADDLGIKDLSYTGSSFYETPHIDRLANQGVVFTQGYAASRVCSPSRASIMTGKFTARHGITDWIGAKSGEAWRKNKRHDKLLPAEYKQSLSVNDILLPEAMKAHGYKTFFAGKWHLGDEGSYPENHGFDKNIGGWDKGSPIGGYFSPWENPRLENKANGENLSMRLAKETVNFISKNKDTNFFAFLSFYAVHGPIQTSQKKWSKYQKKALETGIAEKGYKMEKKLPIRQTQDNPIYAGLVESMDDAVGIVLNALKDLGIDNNTIVVFTSDNGGVASGDAYSTSNLPFRGGKGYQWEGGIREPYFMYIPWLKNKKIKIDYPVTGTDFYPTILDFANIDLLVNEHQDGVSLKPLIEGKILPERPLFWHYPHYGNQGGEPSSIIREGQWKLIYYWEDRRIELYDLNLDPYEQTNVFDQYATISAVLKEKLLTWLVKVNANYPAQDNKYDKGKAKILHYKMANDFLSKLEKERKYILEPEFVPNDYWWGSKVTND